MLYLGLGYRVCVNRRNACVRAHTWDSASLIRVCMLVQINATVEVCVYIRAKGENPLHGHLRVA